MRRSNLNLAIGPARILAFDRRPAYETDFLPAALEIIERPVSPAKRAVAATVAVLVIIAFLWACLGKIDIIAVAPGRILPVGNSKIIQPLETGVVEAILAADGGHVRAGEVLVELDPTSAVSDRDKYALGLLKARLEIARLAGLRRVIAGQSIDLVEPPSDAPEDDVKAARAAMRAQAMEQQAKLAGLDQQIQAKLADAAEASAEIEKLQASLPLTGEQAEIRRQLKEMEFGNKLAWLAAQQKLVEQQHDLPVLVQRQVQATAAAEALRRQRQQAEAEFEKSVLSDFATAKQKAAEFEKERDKAAQRLALLTLKAPIDGTVQQLAIHTVGGVVTPAQALMVVVPDDARIVVEAHIANQDVGFVRMGQTAQIKIEAFNFTRYGLIEGNVLNVSRDSVAATSASDKLPDTDRGDQAAQNADGRRDSGGYIAHVALGQTAVMTEGGAVDLGPGMLVTAEIRTGRRRVIDYLLSPVIKRVSESLHER